MSQVRVIGIADLRGRKKKDGTVMNYAVFHIMTPMFQSENNYGYSCDSLFVNAKVLEGVQLQAPAIYEMEKDFVTNQVCKVKFIGKD